MTIKRNPWESVLSVANTFYGGVSVKKSKREMTEERILEAALNLFSEKGYSGASTSEIAKEANVAEGTIFRYFPQKKDMLLGVVSKLVDAVSDQMVMTPLEKIYEENKNAPPEVLLKALLMDRVALFNKVGEHVKVILTEMQYHEEVLEIFVNKILKKVLVYVEKVYGEFVEKGYFRDDIPPFTVFRTLIAGVAGMVVQRKLVPEITREGFELETEVDMIIDIFMNGMKKRGDLR